MGAGYGYIQCNNLFARCEQDRTKTKTVYVVRHGQRADFLPPEVRPPIELYFDPQLTEVGYKQAKAISKRCQELIPPGAKARIVSSPFRRAIESASDFARDIGQPIYLDDGFGELLHPRDFIETIYPKITVRKHGIEEMQRQWNVTLIDNPNPKVVGEFPEYEPEGFARAYHALLAYMQDVDEDVIFIFTHLSICNGLAMGMGVEKQADMYGVLFGKEYENGIFTKEIISNDYKYVPDHAPTPYRILAEKKAANEDLS